MKYVLAGIDGTGSRTWIQQSGGSSVQRFVDQFNCNGGRKSYFHGPVNEATGSDTENIIHQATQFVMNAYHRLTEEDTRRGITGGVRVFLVGHSRGGYAAIRLARSIAHLTRVEFLGLYDAVDRTTGAATDVITNVHRTYHAVRHPDIGSRTYFGNTGMRQRGGHYHEQMFRTSHGGVGGAAERHPSGLGADYTCAEDYEARAHYASRAPWGPVTPYRGPTGMRAQLCEDQSRAAETWIWEKGQKNRQRCERERRSA